MKWFDWKYGFILVSILALGFLSVVFKDDIFWHLNQMLEWSYLTITAGFISATITVLHKMKNKELKFYSEMTLKDFQGKFETLFSFVSTPLTLVIGITLLKGVYFDLATDQVYFPKFNDAEKIVIIVVAGYLVIISFIQLFDKLIDLLKKPDPDSVNPEPKKTQDNEQPSVK